MPPDNVSESILEVYSEWGFTEPAGIDPWSVGE